MKKITAFIILTVFLLTLIPGQLAYAVAEAVSEAVTSLPTQENTEEDFGDNTEIQHTETSDEFVSCVSELISENWEENYFGEIVVDNENSITVDGNETNQSVYDIVDKGFDENAEKSGEATADFSEKVLNEKGCVVDYEGKKVKITRPYQTKRLILRTKQKELINTYGASGVISDGKGKYILQYDDESAAKRAFTVFEGLKSTVSVSVDKVITVASVNPLTTGDRNRWGSERIESDKFKQYLSDKSKNSKVVVAVIDTGAEMNHPFLKGRLLDYGYDFINDDSIPDDENMHGTHCAGIIADNTPSSVKILPVKVVNSGGYSTESLIALGIEYAVDKKVDVISMSLGGTCISEKACEIEIAVNKAIKAGITCVAAAGNESDNAGNHCPAKLKSCITVASVGKEDMLSDFSNYGEVIDVAAPGEYIWSSTLLADGGYVPASGTSMACPFVAAAAALFLTDDPSLTPSEVSKKIKSTTVDMSIKGEDNAYGAGILDFRIFFKEKKAASSISIKEKTINVYMSENITFDPETATVSVLPLDATDKSYTVSIKDKSIASFDGYGFVGKKAGETTAVFTLSNGKRTAVKIKCHKRKFWIDHAAKKFAGGSGTQSDPYIIKTAEQLARIAYLGDKNKLRQNTYFKQMADIDLKGKTWFPIMGKDQDGLVCRVNFDGNGYDIKNLHIANIYQDIYIYYAGFFATGTGELKNINLIDVDINSPEGNWAGGICADGGTVIKNCYVSGKITGIVSGGIAGSFCNPNGADTYTTITNCRSDATVVGYSAGGIVGYLSGGTAENCIFTGKTYCTNELYPTSHGGIAQNVSGALGTLNTRDYPYDNTKIINCISVEDICDTVYSETRNGITCRPYIANCYYAGEYEQGIKNCEPGGATVKKVEKVDGKLFKTSAFYSEKGRWNTKMPWEIGKIWTVKNDFPVLKNQTDPSVPSKFEYIELRDSIVLTGYVGKSPYVTVPSKIEGKPVRIIADHFISKNADVETIKLPDSVRIINTLAFAYDYSRITKTLDYIDLGKGVQIIEAGAFAFCSALKAISFPKSLKRLDASNFIYAGVSHAFFEGNATEINPYAFGFKKPYKKGIKIYYKKGTKGWNSKKLKNLGAKAYDPAVPVIVTENGNSTVSYKDKRKLKIQIYPVTAKAEALTFKSNNKDIKISKDGYVSTKVKNADAIVSVMYKKKKLAYIEVSAVSYSTTYTVVFNGNGATSGKMANQRLPYRDYKALSENEYKKTGYKFIGWSTKKGSNTIAYADKEKVDKLAYNGKSVTLYAIWEPITYKIKFSPGEGSGKMSAITDVTYTKKIKLPSCTLTAPKGKVFAGWAAKKNGTAVYTDGQKVQKLAKKDGQTVTLYAVWVKPETYKIKYVTNGGKLKDSAKKKYVSGTGCTLESPTKKGYKFAGWYTDKKCTKGKTVVIKPWETGKKTFYAKWKKI
ncbi:MAG: S8 family serine peptidase [Clostridia bacterium]|nr:S8 family serine peptidase [Clostridia bacterium]